MKDLMSFLVVLAAACNGKDVQREFAQHKADVARATAKALAFEAYPQWAAAHPSKECPESLKDLTEYTNDPSTLDPWGKPYALLCGSTLPAGNKGILVVSAGEDGASGTADDIKSSDK